MVRKRVIRSYVTDYFRHLFIRNAALAGASVMLNAMYADVHRSCNFFYIVVSFE